MERILSSIEQRSDWREFNTPSVAVFVGLLRDLGAMNYEISELLGLTNNRFSRLLESIYKQGWLARSNAREGYARRLMRKEMGEEDESYFPHILGVAIGIFPDAASLVPTYK